MNNDKNQLRQIWRKTELTISQNIFDYSLQFIDCQELDIIY